MKNSIIKSSVMMLVMAMFPVLSVNAQEEEVQASGKTTVFLESVGNANSETKAVRNAVVANISSFKRLIFLDAESEAVASKEDMRRTEENVTAGDDMVADRLGAVVRLGAQYYIKVSVDNVVYTQKEKQAKCEITLTAKIIDPLQSKVTATQQMSFTGLDSDGNNDKAFNSALESITTKGTFISQNELTQFLEENFPIVAQILEINEAKKEKAASVYVNAGSDNGVEKSTKFEVFKDKKVGTRVAAVKIGELSASDIQGGDLTLCKVIKGGDVILKEFNEGATLKVKSRKKVGLL